MTVQLPHLVRVSAEGRKEPSLCREVDSRAAEAWVGDMSVG
jgi:hypothetical protein